MSLAALHVLATCATHSCQRPWGTSFFSNAIRSISGWWYFGTRPTRLSRGRRIRPSSFETIRKDESIRQECVTQFWASRQQGQKIGRALVACRAAICTHPHRACSNRVTGKHALCAAKLEDAFSKKGKKNPKKILRKPKRLFPSPTDRSRRAEVPHRNLQGLHPIDGSLGAVLAQCLWLPLSSRWRRHRPKDVETCARFTALREKVHCTSP